MRNSITVKLFVIGFLCLALLVPVLLVALMIDERESRYRDVQDEISRGWGDPQRITGPALVVPYRYFWKDDKNRVRTSTSHMVFLPSGLEIKAVLEPELRARSVYEAVLYRAKIEIAGSFAPIDPKLLKIDAQDVFWSEARLTIGISDMRGIATDLRLDWNGESLSFEPGIAAAFRSNGISASLPSDRGGHDFSFSLELLGTQSVFFYPFGKTTKVEIASAWPDPSFTGAFLPSSRTVTPEGFDALWQVSYFGRSYPQQWAGQQADYNDITSKIDQSGFGVRLLLPVDHYQKTTRSVKYGILFIVLTFVVFFLFEVFARLLLHPLQYLLVGFALCLFYLILLSLSEYLGFELAYLLAACGIVSLVGAYAGAILRKASRALVLGAFLAGLYGYLYILLQLQEFALLLGSLGLFVILGVVMYVTRNVDWYDVKLNAPEEPPVGR